MRRNGWLLGIVLVGVSGCSGMNHTDRGLLTGGAVGAGLGTVAGGLSGHPGAGAVLGGLAGATVGGIVGNHQDKADQRHARAAAEHAARNPPLGLQDVVQMTQQHISDDIIIRQMDATGSYYQLQPPDITYLKQQGVSDRVVVAMQTRRGPVMVQPRGVVVVEPAPPPVAVGIGFGFSNHHHHRRCW